MSESGGELRARVLAALGTGDSMASAARRFGLPLGTVKTWKRRYGAAIPRAEAKPARLAKPQKRERIDPEEFSNMVLTFAIAMMEANVRLCELLQEDDYVRSKDPDRLGVLAGILNDKCGRILDVVASARERR